MVTVQSISTSAEIVVISLWSQHIINLIVKALKAEGFSQLVSFGGMIEYNIKNYFDAIFVELTDQLFQLSSLTVMLRLGSIAGVWYPQYSRSRLPFTVRAFIFSSNSKIGISSTALIPSSLR